jgi:ABC-2 type transport system ATP-binding protein
MIVYAGGEMLEHPIIVNSVWKTFGRKQVLRGISVTVRRGELAYLLGPNGAGKTTLIRTILGFYKPDRGEVRVLGVSPYSSMWERVKRKIGYVPENGDLPERLTGYEILEFFAKLYEPERWEELVMEGARISGLSPLDLSRRVGEYSKGMRRRILLAISLMREPTLLFLDEPFSGIDVITSYRMKKEIVNLTRRGVSVLATSHNILEAERFADRVMFMYEGRIVFAGTVREALESFNAETLEEAFTVAVTGEA